MSENRVCRSQVHVTAFRCLRVKFKKQGLKRRPRPIQRGGGGSHPTPSHVIGNRTVNTTLGKGHHVPTRCTARNFSIFLHASCTPIHYTLLFFWLGKTTIARIDSRRYSFPPRLSLNFFSFFSPCLPSNERVLMILMMTKLTEMKNLMTQLIYVGKTQCFRRGSSQSHFQI